MPIKPVMSRAEAMFREAFDRLKKNKPNRLPKGTPISQNNVAKEAGVDPSALRSTRYPKLSAEIKRWIHEHPQELAPSIRQVTLAKRSATRLLRERIEALTLQRDKATARLLNAEEEIAHLMRKIASLEAQLPTTNSVSILSSRLTANDIPPLHPKK